MAYSRSPVSVIRIENDLRALEEGRGCTWHRPLGDVTSWAYKVRQALYIARRHHPGRFPKLARYANDYTIEIVDDYTVQARITSNKGIRSEAPTSEASPEPSTSTPVHGLEVAGKPRTIVGVRSLTDIISHWLHTQPSNDPLHFPDAQLSEKDLAGLYTWAQSRPIPWGIIRPAGTNALTLMPAGKGTDIPFWRPEA